MIDVEKINLMLKFSYNGVEKHVKPIFINNSTLFAYAPNSENIINKVISYPPNAIVTVSNNNQDFSSTFLQFEYNNFPNLISIFPNL